MDKQTATPVPNMTGSATTARELTAVLDIVDARPDGLALRRRTYELLGARQGFTVADIGCGPGTAAAELAQLGAVSSGVDSDPAMLATARARWPGIPFTHADALQLPYADGALDGYRAEKLYHMLPDPPAAVAEARRVLAPGGRACLVGQDWDAVAIDAAEPALTRALVHARADGMPSPHAARAYRALLRDAGFLDVRCEAHTLLFTDATALPMTEKLAAVGVAAGAVSESEGARWAEDQHRRAADGRLFMAVPVFVVVATSP